MSLMSDSLLQRMGKTPEDYNTAFAQRQTQTKVQPQTPAKAQQSSTGGPSIIMYIVFLVVTIFLSKKIKDGILLLAVPIALGIAALYVFPLWFALIIIGICCQEFLGKPGEYELYDAPNIRRRFGSFFDKIGLLFLLAGITRLVISFFK